MNGIVPGDAAGQVLQLLKVLLGAGVLSMGMPLIVSTITQASWSRPAKEATVLATSVVVGVLAVIAAGVDPLDAAIALPLIVAMTRKAYIDYWKPSGLAPWLEQVTTLRKEPA